MTQFLKKTKLLCGIAGAALLLASPGFAKDKDKDQDAAAQQPEKHHSKMKGAIVGGAAGGVATHGKKGAAVGAGAGALYQHHKNKKAEKKQEKAQQQ